MNLQHVNVKLFVNGDLAVDLEDIIKVFHRWVSEQSLDELLIDVADYRHVPDGPHVMLIGHEADYAIDKSGGRYGLLYNRKAPLEGTNADKAQQALSAALVACERLEETFPSLQFGRQEFDLVVNDRALAPNTDETFAACKDEIEAFAREISGGEVTIERYGGDPRRRFGVNVRTSAPVRTAAVA